MENKKFNLSEKRITPKANSITRFYPYYYEEDVKEFIRILKENLNNGDFSKLEFRERRTLEYARDETLKLIYKLAGEELI